MASQYMDWVQGENKQELNAKDKYIILERVSHITRETRASHFSILNNTTILTLSIQGLSQVFLF